jgi:hypothetical protein
MGGYENWNSAHIEVGGDEKADCAWSQCQSPAEILPVELLLNLAGVVLLVFRACKVLARGSGIFGRNVRQKECHMRTYSFFIALALVCALAGFAIPQDVPGTVTPTPVKDEPEARGVFEKMLETMMTADTLAYKSAYSWKAGGKVIGEAEYRVRLKKPGFARVEGLRGQETAGVLVGDGERFWLYWPNGRPFFSTEDPAEHAKSRLGRYMREDLSADQFSISHRVPLLGAGGGMLVLQPAYFLATWSRCTGSSRACGGTGRRPWTGRSVT